MPQKRCIPCQVCNLTESKYTCARCTLRYCSVPCFKSHKGSAALPGTLVSPLKPLSSLKWPYVPEASEFPDPLQRDDPKPLSLQQYEAVAMSKNIRSLLAAHPELREKIREIDKMRGTAREEALQRALGLTRPELPGSSHGQETSKDILRLREFAEAVESAIRGENDKQLRLEWGE
ncbi:hypothetical protein FISHEDRAFT_36364 [Fistulina hepatica ATCC 64428]|uniref:HIT-type domain-containing protein n=1 Tax=Fistulina hepatica ATCC 64428 TaxID=1128425 RepID=A0A0D7AF26_9AGAR|nr:hypothetical protein FISHEDRAFT_65080 [Fistulina hepatica ATCC 64428]KIY51829.1 hypothetical protein FISHEDRAFT_36364 [Fistulina hepatica ATCC 64428]